jgi:hypothetical protein
MHTCTLQGCNRTSAGNTKYSIPYITLGAAELGGGWRLSSALGKCSDLFCSFRRGAATRPWRRVDKANTLTEQAQGFASRMSEWSRAAYAVAMWAQLCYFHAAVLMCAPWFECVKSIPKASSAAVGVRHAAGR